MLFPLFYFTPQDVYVFMIFSESKFYILLLLYAILFIPVKCLLFLLNYLKFDILFSAYHIKSSDKFLLVFSEFCLYFLHSLNIIVAILTNPEHICHKALHFFKSLRYHFLRSLDLQTPHSRRH